MTPRIPPKNGSVFSPGQVIRLEFPAQGYVNPLHTTLEFDVTLTGPTAITGSTSDAYALRFQNNIQSIFNRVRLLYGATPIEDMINYNVIVRCLTEWTSGNPHMCMDQSTISEGIGGVTMGFDSNVSAGLVNVRQKHIQGTSGAFDAAPVNFSAGLGFGRVPQSITTPPGFTEPAGATSTTRRYQINFALGVFTQEKLIPTKFMASQLAIEITLEQAGYCLFTPVIGGNHTSFVPSYLVSEVNLIPEVLEFDASYDAMFLQGLQQGGVPIKFSSWHTFIFSSANSQNVNLQIQERSRSVKALFSVQRTSQPSFIVDNGATFFDTSSSGTTLRDYQYRIGARYFPAAPVQCSVNTGSNASNGGAEAFVELQKALNIIGDYRLSTPVNTTRWALQNFGGTLQNQDFSKFIQVVSAAGVPTFGNAEAANNSFSGDAGSQCFAMAASLETSNGVEISGLNAEEQSDIALIAHWASPQVSGSGAGGNSPSALEVYTYYDAMIVLRENNVLELIQ